MFRPLNNGLYRFICEAFHSLISPSICEVCQKRIIQYSEISKHICEPCASEMPSFPAPDLVKNELFSNYSASELAISNAYALMRISADNPWFRLIHALKYDSMPGIGFELGIVLGAELAKIGADKFSTVVPVPIHHARLRERGFNQADSIAKGIARATGAQFRPDIVSRKKYTTSQTKLNSTERKSNVSDVFQVNDKLDAIPGHLLVVDDVLTTGATLNSVATALLEAGAVRADVAALVKA